MAPSYSVQWEWDFRFSPNYQGRQPRSRQEGSLDSSLCFSSVQRQSRFTATSTNTMSKVDQMAEQSATEFHSKWADKYRGVSVGSTMEGYSSILLTSDCSHRQPSRTSIRRQRSLAILPIRSHMHSSQPSRGTTHISPSCRKTRAPCWDI